MSQQNRERKRKRSKRNNLLIGLLVFVVLIIAVISYYRNSKVQVLKSIQYKQQVKTEVYFFKDCQFIELDNFIEGDLVFDEGTKVSSYSALTQENMTISASYVDSEVETIDSLISGHYYENWSQLSEDMSSVIANAYGDEKKNQRAFLIRAAKYCGMSLDELNAEKTRLKTLNTSSSQPIMLENLGPMSSGYLFGSISEYQQIAEQSMMGIVDLDFLTTLNKAGNSETEGINIISNDHMYAICSIPSNIDIEGIEEMQTLKEKYAKDLDSTAYYELLTSRVDYLRQYPELSIEDGQEYSAYFVDLFEGEDENLLVLFFKDNIDHFLTVDHKSYNVDVQNCWAWVVPQSAIIKDDDGNTYIEQISQGYFEYELPVVIDRYDGADAILRVSDNENLRNGISIQVFP